MHNKLFKFSLALILSLACWALPASALSLNPEWLTDTTGQLTPESKLEINEISQQYQRTYSAALYTLVVDRTEDGLDDYRYIRQIFDQNKLTEKDALILLDIGTRHVEVFSGQNSGIYEANAQAAIATAKPLLAKNDWNAGTIKLVDSVRSGRQANGVAIVASFALLIVFLCLIFRNSSTATGGGYYGGGYYSSGDSGSDGGGSGGDSF